MLYISFAISLGTVGGRKLARAIERYIRTVKDCSLCIYHNLSFNMIPKRLPEEITYFVIFWINAVPILGGISYSYSFLSIIHIKNVDISNHRSLGFEFYVLHSGA